MTSFLYNSIHTLEVEKLLRMSDIKQFYQIDQQIGIGSYGIVYKAFDIKNDNIKALKINLKKRSGDFIRNYNEAYILKQLSHPNIINMDKVFENKTRICLVLEYCRKELNKILLERKFLTESETHSIMKYLGSAVAFLHSNGVVHRDLKIENILITDNPDDPSDEWFIKIIDFELSILRKNVFNTNDNSEDHMQIFKPNYHDFCGTIQYIAPELYARVFSEKSDIWSTGVIMYVLLVGDYPFPIKITNLDDAKSVIMNSMVNYKEIKCSEPAKNLIKKCLNVNPIRRITAGEILIDEWITGTQEEDESVITSITNIVALMNQYNDEHFLSKESIKSKEQIKSKESLKLKEQIKSKEQLKSYINIQ